MRLNMRPVAFGLLLVAAAAAAAGNPGDPHVTGAGAVVAHGLADQTRKAHDEHQNQPIPAVQNTANTTYNPLTDSDDNQLNSGYAILIFYSFMFLMLGAQTGLFVWKKHHKRSYDTVTLFGLWLVPAAFSVQLKFWAFVTVWFLFSLVTCFLLYKCTKKKMKNSTPRMVYAWFLATHRISVFIGGLGYFALLLDMFGIGMWLYPRSSSITLLWYGIYFGVLGRDTAEVASDQMASSMAYGKSLTNTVTHCGICRNEMKDFSHVGQDASAEEKVVQLSCKHCFHDLCVRGWTMVGKKDTCPVCNEKVDLRSLYADRPWETGNLSWIQMLDMFRYLVVWMPVIFMGFSVVVHVLGLSGHHPPHGSPGAHNSTLASPAAHALPQAQLHHAGLAQAGQAHAHAL